MTKKKKIILVAVIAVIALAVLLAPLPTRFSATLEGTRISADGEETGTVSIQVKGWRFRYLLRSNRVNQARYTVTVSPFGGTEGSEETTSGWVPILANGEGENYLIDMKFDASLAEPEYVAYYLYFTDGFDAIRIDDGTDEGYSYVADRDGPHSAADIYNSFSLAG